MKFLIGLPTDEVEHGDEFTSGPAIVEMAQAAERLGYAGVFVTDHPMPPDAFLAKGGHHALEPTVALAVVAAATTSLELLTNLYIVNYRNPFLAAKAIATLDAVSGGRVRMGTGAGYLEDEFKALGADFENRNDVLDDTLAQMIAAWSGETVVASGPGYNAVGNTALPAPATQPPIYLGGNSKRAIRRAAAIGQGWMPMGAPKHLARFVRTAAIETVADLRERLEYLDEQLAANGRDEKLSIVISPWSAGRYGTDEFVADEFLAELHALADVGVTHVPVNFAMPGTGGVGSRARFLELLDGFAQTIMTEAP
ncbi:MAG: TIGR03619 family F420-dependent LLM class oxidoreductase [Acidimicrobiales bacterium]|nr:TIGR03619 family F420-dependent LLM class oxidoreductase [Acidimicrobiales bacterium]